MFRFHKTSSGDASEAEPICTKIYYASRTHSQLTQTLPEMRRLKLSVPSSYQGEQLHTPSSPPSPNRGKRKSAHDEGATQCSNTIRSVALGSRKQLCIHDDLRKRTTDLDEACRQMLNGTSNFDSVSFQVTHRYSQINRNDVHICHLSARMRRCLTSATKSWYDVRVDRPLGVEVNLK